MRRFVAGILFALVVVAAPLALAAGGGDQTVKGNLTVNGSAFVGGDVQARSVQAISGVISNFGTAFAEQFGSAHIQIAAGGNGFGFLDSFGNEPTRIVIGDPTTSTAPASSLLIQRGPARLWFHTDTGWECIAGCTP